MRILLLVAVGVSLLAVTSGAAQSNNPIAYRVKIDEDAGGAQKVFAVRKEREGKQGLWVTVQFKLWRVRPDGTAGEVATDVPRDEIAVTEDGRPVANLEVLQPRAQRLTTVLALDISGSMESRGKMEQARKAAHTFLDNLDPRANAGLILFDHKIRVVEEPARDPRQLPEHRNKLRRLIDEAKPGGGTAYLDATARAVELLRGSEGRRAVLLMTDGQDMNSAMQLGQVIELAQTAEVPVYTLGIGEPGKNEPVTTVLVLDRSGSMLQRANDTDKVSKIASLREAANRFVDVMARRPNARTTLLSFSDRVDRPLPFSRDEKALKALIRGLKPGGETSLYDATWEGVETLVSVRPEGRKAVVALTDGKDVSSRRSDRAVIERAREAGVPLHMLGLGRAREINEAVMRRMARETGGSYHHATSRAKLFEIFEQLSIDLHDEGIDEESLRRLAKETGGQYHHAQDVSQLHLLYGKLAEELQSTYTATFLSRRQSNDGTARGIDISVVRNGVLVSDVASGHYNRRGLVVPEMHYGVYLVLLSLLGGLLLLPAGVRRLYRFYGGS
jgi:VWFA-related protein